MVDGRLDPLRFEVDEFTQHGSLRPTLFSDNDSGRPACLASLPRGFQPLAPAALTPDLAGGSAATFGITHVTPGAVVRL